MPASAQSDPLKPLRMVVPYAPGGGVDIIGRLMAKHLAERMGMPVIVDNRAGGGTIVGTDYVARAAPDGYTLLFANIALTASPALQPKIPFDPVQSFTAVSLVSSSYAVLVVHPSVPVASLRELVALGKARPGQINYASAGVGSSVHLAMEMFQRVAGMNVVHVPYEGAAPALNDMLGGQVTLMFASLSTAVDYVRSRRLRPLGISSKERRPVLPEVPTITESGLPGFEMNSRQGIVAPAQTRGDVLPRLNAETNAVLGLPEVRQFFARLGPDPMGGTAEELSKRIAREVVLWRRVLGPARPGT